MTITLIGMPAAGKTCMGKMLSKKLNMRTIDGDKLIEKKTGKRLQEIINHEGLEAFKKLEEETLLEITDDNVIITPGGSAVYYPKVMEYFKSKGPVVYLYASPKTIINRLGDFSKRGVVLKAGQSIYDLYDERVPLLEKYADIKVNCNGTAFTKYREDAYNKIINFTK